MLRALAPGFLVWSLLISVPTAVHACNCDEEGFWSVESIQECQRVSDFLIAVAYFSIPLELLYFVSCSNLPFKWVLFEFIAFIVLCGLTHLLNGWTYTPHKFQLMLALTIFKFLTALVSCATAITLITLIPLLLKVKVREFMLKKKARDLGLEVGLIRRQKEAGLHVRMLTQEIRKSLDRHTILYTTMVELSKTLGLQSCAVWMPNEGKTEVILTHELVGNIFSNFRNLSIPISDPDVARIKQSNDVVVLSPESVLVVGSGDEPPDAGAVAGIRMPMLRFSNFKGGTPELRQTYYAILVLVLPAAHSRTWSSQELEIIKVVADQLAVALSHASVLEESQFMTEKLEAQNRILQLEQKNAMMANQARNSFQKVMSNGMRRPMHSILGLLSIIRDWNSCSEDQKMIVDAMMKTSSVLSTLIDDVMDISRNDNGRFSLVMGPFSLHSAIRELACLARCLCICAGFGFALEVEQSLPENVLGDERRLFQVILHMMGDLLNGKAAGGVVNLRISSKSNAWGDGDRGWDGWRRSPADGYVNIQFEIRIDGGGGSTPEMRGGGGRRTSDALKEGSICESLVLLMRGHIWEFPDPKSHAQCMALVLRFRLLPSVGIRISEQGASRPAPPRPFRGLHVLLADGDAVNRAVTGRLLEKLGCLVSAVSSGHECLGALCAAVSSFPVVLLDLHMAEPDGWEVARGIRKQRSRSWPVIIALTASAEEEVRDACMQAGVNGVLRKPFLLQRIADELRRFLPQPQRISR